VPRGGSLVRAGAAVEEPFSETGISAAEIADLVGGTLEGDPTVKIVGVAPVGAAGPAQLAFVADGKRLEAARTSRAGCLIGPVSTPPLGSFRHEARALIRVLNPRLAICRAIRAMHPERRPALGVHATAVLGAGVSLGRDVSVGPNAVVGDGVSLGDRVVVGPGSSVGAATRIGADTVLHANVSIYHDIVVGERVIVHSGAVIGGDGFGFVRDGESYVKFPQVGRVVIEDDVEIGANTTVDRGALGDTVIRRGTKIDNLVQIAHNVELGESCAVSGQTGISGSARIGRDVVLGGQVGIGDHSRIGDRVMIGAQSGVATGKVIGSDQLLLGSPVRPIEDAREIYALLGLLPRLRKEVQELKRQLKDLAPANGLDEDAPGSRNGGG